MTFKELPIRILGDDILRTKSVDVQPEDAELKQIIADMIYTMYLRDGVGLAANQVGLTKRIVVIDPFWAADETAEKNPLVMLNPIIHEREGEQIGEEGCISLPEIFAPIHRALKIRYSYLKPDGSEVQAEAEGFAAVVIQHELDHLDGVVFTDHLSTLARLKILPKLKALEATAIAGVNIRRDE